MRGDRKVVKSLGLMISVDEVLGKLKAMARPDQLEAMARFGIKGDRRLGIPIPDLRRLAKEIGKNHDLACRLWDSRIEDARILASMVDVPEMVTDQQLEEWAGDFNSWDVCDQVCMNLFEKVPTIREKIFDWSNREEEFVKRTAYALIACFAWHDRVAPDEDFIKFFPIIKGGATDERNFVKKAVNWALRNIGKRNLNLNRLALDTAREIQQLDSKAARWIAADANRELSSDVVQKRIKK
jgi:3-methyladenine DNA glycosylase AlkD